MSPRMAAASKNIDNFLGTKYQKSFKMHNHVKDIKTKHDNTIKIIYNTSREEIHNIRVVGVQVKPAHLLLVVMVNDHWSSSSSS